VKPALSCVYCEASWLNIGISAGAVGEAERTGVASLAFRYARYSGAGMEAELWKNRGTAKNILCELVC
jgi:hypothetical protein